MNSEQLILDKWRDLTADEQQEVLDFVDSIAQKLDRSKQAQSIDSLTTALRVKRWIDIAARVSIEF